MIHDTSKSPKTTPYHVGTSTGVGIVCTEMERKVIDWAIQQQDRYNITHAPKWATMPDYFFKDAKEAYEKSKKQT